MNILLPCGRNKLNSNFTAFLYFGKGLINLISSHNKQLFLLNNNEYLYFEG